MDHVPKVFCSHRVVDRSAVEAFTRRLCDRGIKAWLDKWEIQPGDDFVQGIMVSNLRGCRCSGSPSGGPGQRITAPALQSFRSDSHLTRYDFQRRALRR